MGKTTNKLLAIAQRPSRASARSTSASSTTCAISTRARRAWWCRSSERAELDRFLDEHFQELTELVKGLAVLGELTPRSIDAISSYGERLSSYIVTLAFRHFGMKAEHVDSRDVIVTDKRHTQAAPQFPGDLRAARRRPFRRWRHDSVVVMGGFIGSTEDGVTTTLGRGGSRFHRLHRGRGHRRRRDPDLDRRGRHAHRRPHHPARRPSRQDHLLRRSRRTRLLRRQGAAPGHRGAGDREEHSGADPEFAPARRAWHAHHRRIGALRQRREIDRLQAQDHASSTSTPRAC